MIIYKKLKVAKFGTFYSTGKAQTKFFARVAAADNVPDSEVTLLPLLFPFTCVASLLNLKKKGFFFSIDFSESF